MQWRQIKMASALIRNIFIRIDECPSCHLLSIIQQGVIYGIVFVHDITFSLNMYNKLNIKIILFFLIYVNIVGRQHVIPTGRSGRQPRQSS